MRIEVEPQALIAAGALIKSAGEQLAALSDALSAAFSSGLASGVDGAGMVFGLQYEQQAEQFAKTLAGSATAFKNIGFMLEASGYNYLHADQASTIGGPGPSGSPGDVPSKTDAHLDVHTNWGLVPPPPKWFLIEPLLVVSGVGTTLAAAMSWPTGDSGLMKVTAAQWHNINSGLTALQTVVAPARAMINAQKIPEGPAISSALDTLDSAMPDLIQQCSTIAQSIDDFAGGVQQTQDAIRRTLDRLTSFNTIKDLLTGDGKKVLEEIARDVSVLLNNLQRQVKALTGALDLIKGKLNDLADRLEKWLKPTLVSLLGEEVGGAIADYAIARIDISVGVLNGVIGTVSGVVAMADPDTWKGMAELATSLAEDPSKIPGTLKEMGKQFVAWDQWSGDHPGRALGEAGFNIGSLFLPGGAASKTGSIAKAAKFGKSLLDEGKLGKLGDLTGLGSKTTKLNELDHVGDLGSLGSKMPEVPEFKPGAMPGSHDGPRVPTVADPPPSPRGLEGPHDPPGPDHTPVKGDGGGGHSEQPTGPTDSGPRQHDAPTNPSSNGPAHSGDSPRSSDSPRSTDGPRSTESPPTNHTPSGDSPSTSGQHSPESTTRPGGADEGRTPSAHDQPTGHDASSAHDSPSARDTGGHATNDTGHDSDRGTHDGRQSGDHTPNAEHRPLGTEHGGRSESHSPTEHQPAHEPRTSDSAHDRNGQSADRSPEHSRLSDGNPAERHDSGTPASGLANAMGAGLHGPASIHGPTGHSPSGGHTPIGKPDGTPTNRETTSSKNSPTERPSERPASAGPAARTPSAPIHAYTQSNVAHTPGATAHPATATAHPSPPPHEPPPDPHPHGAPQHPDHGEPTKPEDFAAAHPPLHRETPYQQKYMPQMFSHETDPHHPQNPFPGQSVERWPPEKIEQHRVVVDENGLMRHIDGRLVDTHAARSHWTPDGGRAIFTMDPHGNMYVSMEHQRGVIHHSTLASGRPVAGAGEVSVVNGRLVELTDSSGHYRPLRSNTKNVLEELASRGIDIRSVNIHLSAPEGT